MAKSTSKRKDSRGPKVAGECLSPKLLRRFYEPLVLLSILEPTQGPSEDLAPSRNERSVCELWKKFLNNLSWACDYESGGYTVTAVAAEATPSCPIFWLAANREPTDKVVEHIDVILHIVEALHDLPEAERHQLEGEIVRRCVEFSSKRVDNYSRILSKKIQGIRPSLVESPAENDRLLLNYFDTIVELRSRPQDLCSSAYGFRRTQLDWLLIAKQNAGSPQPLWSSIRHCIGRLGSWHKAANVFLETGTRLPRLFPGFQIRCLRPPQTIHEPDLHKPTTVQDALGRMVAHNDELATLRNDIGSSRAFDEVNASFARCFSRDTFKPRVHAEMLLHEYFYQNHLDFVDQVEYIGCSKPSCYCCDLYMKVHPARFLSRPSHGNIWVNWRPPIPPNLGPAEANIYTRDRLNEMVKTIRRDVLAQIKSRLPRRPRLPDSTTGISSTNWVIKTRSHLANDASRSVIFTDTGGSQHESMTVADDIASQLSAFSLSDQESVEDVDQESTVSIDGMLLQLSRDGSSEGEDDVVVFGGRNKY